MIRRIKQWIRGIFSPDTNNENKFEGLRLDLINYKSKKHSLQEIMNIVEEPDWNSIEFDNDYDILPMRNLSESAKNEIRKIIMDDLIKHRQSKLSFNKIKSINI